MTDIILSQSNGIVTADSRMIAEHFGKQHKDVLRTIDDLAEQTSAQKSADLFLPSTYRDAYGREQRNYQMTRDGFSLLVMGFTGSEALAWKLKYIDAFNRMEAALKTKPVTQAEVLAGMANLLVEQEKRINAVEAKVERIAATCEPIPEDGWQTEIERRIREVCKTQGLDYRDEHRWLYVTLEARAHVDLSRRHENRVERMRQAGATIADMKASSKLAVIAADPGLRSMFERVVSDWARIREVGA